MRLTGLLTDFDKFVICVTPEESVRKEGYNRVDGWHVKDSDSKEARRDVNHENQMKDVFLLAFAVAPGEHGNGFRRGQRD